MPFRRIPVPEGTEADFAAVLSDDSLEPWFHEGETVFLRRNTELFDGDVGLFETESGVVFRQFCTDSRGAVYLFSVNRAHAADDRVIEPPESAEVLCFGRLMTGRQIPLPAD